MPFPPKLRQCSPWWRSRPQLQPRPDVKEQTLDFVKLALGLPFLPETTSEVTGAELLVKCLGLPREEREGRRRGCQSGFMMPLGRFGRLSMHLPLLQKSPCIAAAPRLLCHQGPTARAELRPQGWVPVHKSVLAS